ncbi:hypothetical protein CONCODRAFT_59317 [Conidiobolus coronatus NRRL 28638]|uniref:NADH dehydrogenase [ubiquinone] 1 beta subcomplex subunit 7 n=1 Tax=Conidiobolus coronatus (strain ATCC 28846 / CBS 209.66 / NRRL 28638) TaxID=796925 RepID=A0A137P373_CONC2|nr:hypothetical protein CONCODRAFT_59317 [Conidiobolus coronatus NRRL 28638]|eukprot:KXN69476.1 hypothetical protein CONCODRAFT_59317 [Conidiobolus coronatus NRRL 28638]
MQVSPKELKDNRVPLHWRDYCAHLVIPLNKCRYDNYYKTWACQDEKHAYEKCQYDDLQRRMAALKELKAQQNNA